MNNFFIHLPARLKACLLWAVLHISTAVSAQVVTNINDAGAGSLRQAILDANTNADANIISFQSGLSGTISLSAALPDIINPLTISGPGASIITISGSNTVSIFNINSSAAVIVQGLSIINGKNTGAGAGIGFTPGGLTGPLIVSNCVFAGNNSSGSGGAINYRGVLTVTNSSFTNNSASSAATDFSAQPNGGAIAHSGNLIISGCTFSGNSVFSANTVFGLGGAVYLTGSVNGSGSISNSSFSGNAASFGGGALAFQSDNLVPIVITNCTISGNTSRPFNFGQGGGGGIITGGVVCTVKNTIVSGNQALSSSTGPDVYGQFVSQGNNFIGSKDGSSGFTNGVNGDIAGTTASPIDPLLGPLGNYGGSTQTMPLLPGSAAINAGTSNGAPATDQRGFARSLPDIGAFESQGFILTITGGNKQNAVPGTDFANKLSVAISSAFNEPVNGGIVNFTAPSSGVGASIAGNPATIVSASAITGTVTANSIKGSYIVTAFANGVGSVASFNLSNQDVICESANAQAYISAINTGNQAHRGELGLAFTVVNPAGIAIKQLGAFDDKGNGITGLQPGGGVRVAVFNRATQTIVNGLDVSIAGLADAYTGNHRLKNITPVILPPGNYMLVTKGYGPDELNGNTAIGGGPYPPGGDANGAIVFGTDASYGPDNPSGFSYPSVTGNFGSSHPFLAGTFTFTSSTPCPQSDLSNLVIETGTLAPAFAPGITSYTVAEPNTASTITIRPTAAYAGSTIKVNGAEVRSGNPIGLSLAEGSNQVYVVVTAADNTTTKTYTLNITRAITGACQSAPAQAYSANAQAGTQMHRGELGMQFRVNNPNGIIINQLGAFDDGGNGITGLQSGGIRVAIFNRATRQLVPGLNTVISGTADPLSGNHRMKSIMPVTLPQGDYLIVAKGYGPAEKNGNFILGGGPFPAGNDGGGAITFGVQSAFGPDDANGFSYPATEGYFGSDHVFEAGSFSFTTAIPCGGGACESAPVQAYTSNITTGNQVFRGELGMEFIVNNPGGISIKQLGAFDDGGNGITGTQPGASVRVAIFNRTTHQVVPGLDVSISGAGDAYNGNHRMRNVAPVTLLPGDYSIVTKGYGPAEMNGNKFIGNASFTAGDNGNGAISFGSMSGYGADDPAGFGYPTTEGDFGNGHVFLAGTFNFTSNISCSSSSSRTAVVLSGSPL